MTINPLNFKHRLTLAKLKISPTTNVNSCVYNNYDKDSYHHIRLNVYHKINVQVTVSIEMNTKFTLMDDIGTPQLSFLYTKVLKSLQA